MSNQAPGDSEYTPSKLQFQAYKKKTHNAMYKMLHYTFRVRSDIRNVEQYKVPLHCSLFKFPSLPC